MAVEYTDNLPQFAYSAQQVQKNEGQAAQMSGTTLSELMQRAGQAAFRFIQDHQAPQSRILILTGKGNNAGDGFVVARLCQQAGFNVTVWALFDPEQLQGDAQKAYQAFKGEVVTNDNALALGDFNLIVDAVFGTGFRGELPANVAACFAKVNPLACERLALDVPSGVNATSATVAASSFVASATVTFIALKKGLLTGSAKRCVGRLYHAGLEVSESFKALVEPEVSFLNHTTLMAARPVRALDSYKNSHGHVLLIGGNRGMPGAIRLAAEAALRSGAGLVSVATHPDNVATVIQGRYELMVHGVSNTASLEPLLAKATVVVLGPGLGQDSWSQALFTQVLESDLPMVIDADGLNLLAEHTARKTNWVLTPHLGEAKRLIANTEDAIDEQNRFQLAAAISAQYNAVSVLKGPGSLICQQSRVNINRSGCAAMASAGMGDVLSGIIGSLMAQGMEPFAATNLAVYIHGLAAELAARAGEKGLLAGDLFEHIRGILE